MNLLAKECRLNKASRAKGIDDAWLCLKEEARIAFDNEERCHRRHLAASLKRLRHCQEAAAQAAASAVLLLAEDRRRHEAPELATHMRTLAASRDCADIEAIAYEASALPTTTSQEPPAMLSPSPHPTSSYLGAVLNTNGGGAFVFAFDVAYRGGSTINFCRQRPTPLDPPSCPTSSSHWMPPPSSRSQPSRRGAFLTPYTDIGGRITVMYRQHPTDGLSLLSASSPPWSPSSTSSTQPVL